jgi:hypothetical protein
MLLAAGALLVAISFSNRSPDSRNPNNTHAAGRQPGTAPEAAASSVRSPVPSQPSGTATKPDADERLRSALDALRAAATPDAARKILADLHDYLTSLPPGLAAAAITSFLADPARDAATRIEFAIGKEGSLSGQPSLRVALLDWLGKIDPQQAGLLAKQILATPTAADEWAVCLRNYARANTDAAANEYLRTKTEELIANPKWRENPSVGFLESFDVLVHTHATASTPLLSNLIQQKDRRDLAHAGFLTLDRLVQSDPAEVMPQLAADRALQQSRPEMVANMLARADLRDTTQQQLVRDYLLDPARTPTELTAFAGVFPNANFAISNNLLTLNPTLARDEISTRDTAALAIINTWLDDPDFAPVKPHLTTMHDRLATFVGQTQQ